MKPIVAVAREAVKSIAAVAREPVKPIPAVVALGAAKPTAVHDDDVDDLCRRVYRERCDGPHGPVEPRRRAPGRRLAALLLWPRHGCRRHLCSSTSSLRPESGLPLVHRGRCLSSVNTSIFQHQIQRGGCPAHCYCCAGGCEARCCCSAGGYGAHCCCCCTRGCEADCCS